jgi:hypothetical protein
MNKRDENECARFKGYYSQICPNEWVSFLLISSSLLSTALQTETWDEQRAAGVFPGVQLDPLPGLLKKHH